MEPVETPIPRLKEISLKFDPIIHFIHAIGRNYQMLTVEKNEPVDWESWVLRIDYEKLNSEYNVESLFKIAYNIEEWYFDRILINPHITSSILEEIQNEIMKRLYSLHFNCKYVWQSFEEWKIDSSLLEEFNNQKIFTGHETPRRILHSALRRIENEIQKIIEYFSHYGLKIHTESLPFKGGYTLDSIIKWVNEIVTEFDLFNNNDSIKQTYGHSIIDYIRQNFCVNLPNNNQTKSAIASCIKLPGNYKIVDVKKTYKEYADNNKGISNFIKEIEKLKSFPKPSNT